MLIDTDFFAFFLKIAFCNTSLSKCASILHFVNSVDGLLPVLVLVDLIIQLWGNRTSDAMCMYCTIWIDHIFLQKKSLFDVTVQE